MKVANELTQIFGMIHNESSTATMPPEFEFKKEERKETFLDKYILRWV